jgi:hypothetical protein
MLKINHNQLIAQFRSFRQQLRDCFESYSDSIIDLIDALSGNSKGNNSVVELSLSPLFQRTYNSLYKAISSSFNTSNAENNQSEKFTNKLQKLVCAVAQLIPTPKERPFYLFAIDTTPAPRPYAQTMPERGYIYQPNTIKGNKPVNIGYSYSIVSTLPEKNVSGSSTWSIPLSAERVPTDKSGTSLGSEQIKSLLLDKSLPWHDQLCVVAADSTYSQRSFLFEQCQNQNLVVIARVRSNRVFYQSPPASVNDTPRRGCPKKYGSRFSLASEDTWRTSDEIATTQNITHSGRQLTVMIQTWHNMLMRGTKQEKMYRHPFTLMRISVTDDTNTLVWKPMWLIVIGNQRHCLSSLVAYQSYRQRFDIEHMLRFSKQRLLMTQFQTPEVEHEENWIRLVMLAYVQLWAAKDLACHLPRPWERYLKQNGDTIITPSTVQRDFQRIISEIGKPGHSPKPRGNSNGRVAGQTQPKRSKHPVVKKGKKSNNLQEKAA